ncbi:E3 ubiquitin-protein ligase RAD18-like isoform X1 [Formica exsecta]|uniref:E3 ubiquitin-protein ligase RAD18-like isoform X1 n=1 Tax=Formica exsecta TaxID=72781 RepID=UPI001142E72D|nr:E3 ubiquitin-protein ligase RAD18-like isoform X1 [Formica exsecta]
MELKYIDKLLQCGICYEYMDTSVITSCSHNYCSLCIRKYLHYKTQCPMCFEEIFEKDLRKNNLLDEIIIHYLNFKDKLEKKICQKKELTVEDKNFENICSSNNFECKKKQNVPDINEILDKSFDSPTSMASNTTPRGQKNYQQNISTPSTSTELRVPSMFTPKRKSLQNEENQPVTCPVCKVDVSQNNINKHLDDCLKRENTKNQPKKSEPKRKPLPKLVLSLMKDNVIRKKLKELGLSSQGDRKALENRLQKYIILYNAECDKINPRSVSELIKQCEEEENLEKKVQKPLNRLNVNRNTEHNIIEQQRKKYLVANKDSYDQLIMEMKHPNSSRKLPVRRNILSKENSDVPYKDCVTDSTSTIRDGEKSNLLALKSSNEDSNISCSSMNPINFLTIELSSSSNDSNDHYASNLISNDSCKIEPVLSNFIVKTENIKNEELLFPENTVIHEETISSKQSRECNATENGMDTDSKESISALIRLESENRRKHKLSVKRSRNNMKCSPEKRVAYSEPKDRQKDSCNEEINSVVEDIEYFIGDSDNSDIQDYERSKDGQLYNVTEKYTSDCTKFEKENLESSDENIKSYIFRKREREMTFTSSDKEKIIDKSTNARKSFRFGLSEARGFNNENFEDKMQDEEKLQNEKEPLHVTRSYVQRHLKLKSKISNDMKKLTN